MSVGSVGIEALEGRTFTLFFFLAKKKKRFDFRTLHFFSVVPSLICTSSSKISY